MPSGHDPRLAALKRVAILLKQAELPFALAGGYAVYARGGAGSEHDVDFVLREQDVPMARQVLEADGIQMDQPPEDWLTKAIVGGNVVDLIYELPTGRVDDALLARCEEIRVGSVKMPVLGATDLLLSKLGAMSEHYCDLAPLLRVTRSLREQVDWELVRVECKRSPFAAAYLTLVDELQLMGPS